MRISRHNGDWYTTGASTHVTVELTNQDLTQAVKLYISSQNGGKPLPQAKCHITDRRERPVDGLRVRIDCSPEDLDGDF